MADADAMPTTTQATTAAVPMEIQLLSYGIHGTDIFRNRIADLSWKYDKYRALVNGSFISRLDGQVVEVDVCGFHSLN